MSTEHHSEALVAAAHDAVLVVDDARTFVDANPAACRLLGLSVAELRGRRFDEFLAPTRELETAWETFLRTGEHRGELQVIRPDGEIRHVEYSATARFMAGRHLAILRDIADRKRTEAERAELQRREQLRLRETETLLAVSRAMSSTLDPSRRCGGWRAKSPWRSAPTWSARIWPMLRARNSRPSRVITCRPR